MDDMEIRKKALAQLMGDMDGLEGEGMFKEGGDGTGPADATKGVDVTISVVPRAGEPEGDEAPAGDTMEDSQMSDEELRGLPPFMRKGRK